MLKTTWLVALVSMILVGGCGIDASLSDENNIQTEQQPLKQDDAALESHDSTTDRIKCKLRCGGTIAPDDTVQCCYYKSWACSGGSRTSDRCKSYPRSYRGFCGSDVYCN